MVFVFFFVFGGVVREFLHVECEKEGFVCKLCVDLLCVSIFLLKFAC